MKAFSALQRTSVMHQVMEQIKNAMGSGLLRRGDRLPPEPQLAEELQVSRASLREVLKVLEFLGIIETHRGTGTFIAEKPKQPAADPLLFLLLLEDGSREQLIELRFIMESSFTKQAQLRLNAQHIKELEASIQELEQAVARGDVTADHDLAFHGIILEATGNPFVIQVGSAVFELFRESIGRGVREYPGAAIAHHKQILRALISKDGAEVEKAIAASYDFWRQLVGDQTTSSFVAQEG